jgi:hypothetical protein
MTIRHSTITPLEPREVQREVETLPEHTWKCNPEPLVRNAVFGPAISATAHDMGKLDDEDLECLLRIRAFGLFW